MKSVIVRSVMILLLLFLGSSSVLAADESVIFTTLLKRGGDHIVVDGGRYFLMEDTEITDLNGVPLNYYEIEPPVRVELNMDRALDGKIRVKKIVVLKEKKVNTTPE